MKTICLSAFALFVSMPAFAAATPVTEAESHVGQSATVEGVVSGVHTARSGKATFIDLGGHYPSEAFTAVIFERNMAAVGDASGLEGKTIDVTGTIQKYQGRPEVVITARDQLHVK